jgi:D-glycero-alpha-D-manno-heptose 1-phosphate guanylyltransferase
MQIKEAIILAGGLGTRLRNAVPDLPKCMAPVAGRPFLFNIINYLRSQGIEKFIFSLGYKHEVIEEYLHSQFSALTYKCVVEEEPLGTGGAIKLACSKANEENVLVTNGDTLFKISIDDLAALHHDNAADVTLALKPMTNFERYGIVETNENNFITKFREKQFCKQGNINGGVYLLNVIHFMENDWPPVFSFEKDFLEISRFRLFGSVQDSYFIDIGIPEDFQRAQTELSHSKLNLNAIDKSWTLFLDRDGVINEDKVGSYIFNADEFVFLKGAPKFFKKLTEKFGHIIVVTNQRGVGRGLMSENELNSIHEKMNSEINTAGGKIDSIYFATAIINDDPFRKPNPGMAFKAKADFPSINFSKSIMVGNKLSDMFFGKNAGMYTVFIATTNPETPFPHPDIDLRFDLLQDFVKALPADRQGL